MGALFSNANSTTSSSWAVKQASTGACTLHTRAKRARGVRTPCVGESHTRGQPPHSCIRCNLWLPSWSAGSTAHEACVLHMGEVNRARGVRTPHGRSGHAYAAQGEVTSPWRVSFNKQLASVSLRVPRGKNSSDEQTLLQKSFNRSGGICHKSHDNTNPSNCDKARTSALTCAGSSSAMPGISTSSMPASTGTSFTAQRAL